MTNIESIAQAYEHARDDENRFTTRFTFECPAAVYDTLLREYGIRDNDVTNPVPGGFISARAKRVSPFFRSTLNPTPMVHGTVVVSGFSQTGMDQLINGIIDCFHSNQVSYGYELVAPYQCPTQIDLEPLRPSD